MNPLPGNPAHENRPVAGFSRRALMGGALSVAAASALPWQLQKVVAQTPAGPRGRLKDIKHVVILMQENRSFDHYFGALPGVRGFNDPDAITLPNGDSVFEQPVPGGGTLRPFRLNTETTSAQESVGLPHDWDDQHHAWNGGAMDSWIAAKGRLAMGYHTVTTSRSTGRWRRTSPSATTTSAR